MMDNKSNLRSVRDLVGRTKDSQAPEPMERASEAPAAEPRYSLTPEQEQEFAALLASGIKVPEIAERMHVPAARIYHTAQTHGIRLRTKRIILAHTKTKRETIPEPVRERLAGEPGDLTIAGLAAKYGLPYPVTHHYVHAHGIPYRDAGRFTDAEAAELRAICGNGSVSLQDLADRLQMTPDGLRKKLKGIGIHPDGNGKFFVPDPDLVRSIYVHIRKAGRTDCRELAGMAGTTPTAIRSFIQSCKDIDLLIDP